MHQNTLFHCYHVDHSFYSAKEIGKLYSTVSQKFSRDDLGDSVVLATCQRIEAYTTLGFNPLAALQLPFKHISGWNAVKHRLTSIACGVESQILGERNVYHQVINAFRDEGDDSELKRLCEEAVDDAEAIRDEHGFYADRNYEDISLAILQDSLDSGEAGAIGLVVVGSGMLARNFLDKGALPYDPIVFLTRSPKNLKKKLDDRQKMGVMRCGEFLARHNGPYHCIIATNGLDKDNYAETVRPILVSSACKAVFDLSAAPLFQCDLPSTFYVDTYSSLYFKHVNRHNRTMLAESQRIKDVILNRAKAVA